MIIRILIFSACLLPLVRLGWLGYADEFGANPVEFVTHSLGTWALVMLLITLSMTPVSRYTSWCGVLCYRRMLGLFAFFYASLHLLSYVGLDFWFDWPAIAEDIVEHPYVMLGMAAWILLVPLAATSTDRMMRRLGRRWSRLHRMVYLIAILAVVHFLWLVKQDIREPVIYAVALFALLTLRVLPKKRMVGYGEKVTPSQHGLQH